MYVFSLLPVNSLFPHVHFKKQSSVSLLLLETNYNFLFLMTLKGKQRSSQTDYWHFSLFVCPITLFIHMLFNHRGVTLTGDEKARMHFTLTYFFKNSASFSELHNHSPSLTAAPPPVEGRSLWVDKKKKSLCSSTLSSVITVRSQQRALQAAMSASCALSPHVFFFGSQATDKNKLSNSSPPPLHVWLPHSREALKC